MSKRFDGKEEAPAPVKIQPVSETRGPRVLDSLPLQSAPASVKSAVTKEDEAAAMAAMFQAQTANWEETQEKMSQLVSPHAGFCLRSSSMSNERCLLLSLLCGI